MLTNLVQSNVRAIHQMKTPNPFFESKVSLLLCVVASIAVLVIPCELLAQVAFDKNWQETAEARMKAIYDRGEFRAKGFRPTWLSDSSGFVVEEPNPATDMPVTWFYNVMTGNRVVWESDSKSLVQEGTAKFVFGTRRLEVRRNRIVAIDQSNRQETILVTGAIGRDIEFRSPVWSSDGSRVLFIEADYTDVRQRSVLVPGDPSYPEVEQHRFARVGGKIERLRVGVVDMDGGNLMWLPVDCPDEGMYLGQVEWAGNSDEILLERFSRFRDRRDFMMLRIDGSVRTIYSETNDAWVEASQGWNSGLVWVQGGSEFVVVSEQDGWRHARRYSRDGTELALLTPGHYDIIDRAVIDEERGWYYFYASPEDGTQKYLYRVPLDGSGKMQRMSPKDQPGTHSYVFSPDAKWAVHTYATLNKPPVHELIEVETHRVVCLLEDNHEVLERMNSIACSSAEFRKLNIGDGIVLDAWLLKPPHFDPSKRYPVLVYVYGEPHAQTVLDDWGAAQIDFHRVVAEMGYVVVSIDNRGTPAPKGAAWRRAIFGSLGPLSTEEQEAGLKALAKQCSFIDLSRVGIWGWSGGGSNTLNALFRKPDSYHVGIAVVPKPQPHLYNAWFQEIFMRTREVNAEGYQRSAPIHFAEGLKGKLLIVTGSGETNTHIQIIEGLVDRLITLGKPFDYMVYPNRDHGLREGDGTVVHVRMHILRYLLQNLPAGPRT